MNAVLYCCVSEHATKLRRGNRGGDTGVLVYIRGFTDDADAINSVLRNASYAAVTSTLVVVRTAVHNIVGQERVTHANCQKNPHR